jgi:catechol 2,3-dioxygenase-like lactoylglutathione lyase family enzyme
MADLEVGGLRHASSITRDAARNVGFYTGVLGMRLLYRSLNFDDHSNHHLANGASSCSIRRTYPSGKQVRRSCGCW